MNNTVKLIKFYITPAAIFGTSIAAINMYNRKLSPVYNPNKSQFNNNLRILGMSGIKGCIYGIFLPVSAIGIGLNLIYSERKFHRHFIPFSKYGNR